MKVFAVLAATMAVAAAAPGGYTLNGGVYHNKERNLGLDYMDAAKSAGQFAWGLKIEEDQVQELAQRGARNTPEYTPTFFTAPNNHQALLRAQPAVARNAEVAVAQGPIYRRAY